VIRYRFIPEETRLNIAFCTTCKGRTFHLEQTLPKNLADNEKCKNYKFVVLDYNSPDGLLEYLKGLPEIRTGRVVVYSFREYVPFQMAHAKNMCHRLGILEGADVLCNLDADNFTGAGFAEYIAGQFTNYQTEPFLWANRNQPSEIRYPKGCNGRIAVSRNAFLISGGYDETKYNSWGPDDKDFHHRLRRLEYEPRELPRCYLDVILHNDKMRFKEYAHLHAASSNVSFGEIDDSVTIANFGRFGCGTVYRNFDFSKPIELAPLPTRIFGIGMHKTGTSSLHAALQILGFDSAHWKSVRWAKKLWMEMAEEGRSLTLEKHYSLSDLPIPMLFQKLDASYPGSKFILTIRNEESWLKSVKNHWSKWNQFKGTWKKENAFPLQIHKELYGTTDFNEAVFLARFRRHNQEVQAHFKNRSDLLVMDMAKPSIENWKDLCGFLGQPIPSEPYPIAFSSEVRVEPPAFSADCPADSLTAEEIRALKVLARAILQGVK
jgi:hypothetical protein